MTEADVDEITNSILDYVENYGEQKYRSSLDNRAELHDIISKLLDSYDRSLRFRYRIPSR